MGVDSPIKIVSLPGSLPKKDSASQLLLSMKEEKKDSEYKELNKVIEEYGGVADDSDEEEAK